MRIVDRDIAFYEGMKQQHIDDLKRCDPELEPMHHKLIQKAEAVVKALKAYRELMDKPSS
jgi:hypothetical protein